MFPFAGDTMLHGAIGLSDGIGGDDILAFCAGGITVMTFLLLFFGKFISPLYHRISTFVDWLEKFRVDWEGSEEDSGHDRVPGVMERLNNIDGEFKRNGGSTMKDTLVKAVKAAENNGSRLDDLVDEVKAVKDTVESMVSPGGGEDNRINVQGEGQS